MNQGSDAKEQPASRPRDPAAKHDPDADAPVEAEAEAEVEHRDKSGGPGTVGWWLDDGPDSPIAADIEDPEKHL